MKESTELKNFVNTLDRTDPKETLAFYKRLWAKDPGTDFIGNAPGNYWRGYENIMALWKAIFENTSGPLPQYERKNIWAYEEGTVGWANWNTIQKLPSGKELEWREGAVFHREDGEWKVVHAHSSLPVPDGEAFEGNEGIVRKFIDAFSHNDMTILDEVCHPHLLFHQSPYPDFNLEAVKRRSVEITRVFPDLRLMLDEVISKGDRVIIRGVDEGTHSGEFEGIQPTGKKLRLTWIEILRIENGKIAEIWHEANDRVLYDQLGVQTPSLAVAP